MGISELEIGLLLQIQVVLLEQLTCERGATKSPLCFSGFSLPLLGLIKMLGGHTVFQFPTLPFKSTSPRSPCLHSAVTKLAI